MENMNIRERICQQIRESFETKENILHDSELLSLIETVGLKCIDVYRSGRKIILAGNGGSAADAQHLAAELVGKFYFDRPGLPCVALTTNTSVLTAIGNDYEIGRIFARQVDALAQDGDVVIGISTSGESPNVLAAIRVSREKDAKTMGLSGRTGGELKNLTDLCITIPSNKTSRIQEAHITIGHIICSLVEAELFKDE